MPVFLTHFRQDMVKCNVTFFYFFIFLPNYILLLGTKSLYSTHPPLSSRRIVPKSAQIASAGDDLLEQKACSNSNSSTVVALVLLVPAAAVTAQKLVGSSPISPPSGMMPLVRGRSLRLESIDRSDYLDLPPRARARAAAVLI